MSYWGIGTVNTDCPFYKRESEKEITCEGAEPGTLCAKKFTSKAEKEDFQKHHCFPGCVRCHNAEKLFEGLEKFSPN